MKGIACFSTLAVFGLTALTSCSLGHHGPIAERSDELHSEGSKLQAQGDKLVHDGVDLQNHAKELHVLAGDDRNQANLADSAGDPDKAQRLRVEADKYEVEAKDDELKGRDMEAQGRDFQSKGEATIQRSQDLQQESKDLDRKTVD